MTTQPRSSSIAKVRGRCIPGWKPPGHLGAGLGPKSEQVQLASTCNSALVMATRRPSGLLAASWPSAVPVFLNTLAQLLSAPLSRQPLSIFFSLRPHCKAPRFAGISATALHPHCPPPLPPPPLPRPPAPPSPPHQPADFPQTVASAVSAAGKTSSIAREIRV